MLTKIGLHVRSYGAAYSLVALHFGGATSRVAIAVSCVWLFVHFVGRNRVDLYLIFVLLTPSIVFVATDPGAQDLGATPAILEHFTSVVFVGPVALSTRLVFSLAILVRVLLRFKTIHLRALTASWLTAVGLAAVGLIYSVMIGNKNPAGLTVGFRIALSVGAVLVPRCVRSREEFVAGLDRILFVSMLLLVLGLTSGHWLFIAFGLIPYAWLRLKPRLLALFPFAYALKILASQSSTLTVLGIIFVSLTFLALLTTNRLTNHLLRRNPAMIAGLALPILLTIFVLRLPVADRFDPSAADRSDLTSIKDYAEFKLLGDRKPVWDASFDQITGSSMFVIPAGSVMDVYFPSLGLSREWFEGSHNIFLEMGRQIGALGMILLTVVIVAMLYKTGRRMRTTEELVLFYCFLSIYIVFGVTGNSVVYDGVGALYWLLVGQLYQSAAGAQVSCPMQRAIAVRAPA